MWTCLMKEAEVAEPFTRDAAHHMIREGQTFTKFFFVGPNEASEAERSWGKNSCSTWRIENEHRTPYEDNGWPSVRMG